MKPFEITNVLQSHDVTQVDIAVSVQLPASSRTLVSMVIRRLARSRRVEQAIAQHAQLPLHKVFPEWYEPSGKRKKAKRPIAG